MSLYHKLKAIYPNLKDDDFLKTIVLTNANGVSSITKWDHPTLVQPTQAQLDAAVIPSQTSIAAKAEIEAIERSVMIPRVVREFMLEYYEALPPGIRNANQGYPGLKAADERIRTLRAKL